MSRSSQYAYPRLKNRSASLPSSLTASPKIRDGRPPGATPAAPPQLDDAEVVEQRRVGPLAIQRGERVEGRLVLAEADHRHAGEEPRLPRERLSARHLAHRQRLLVLAQRGVHVPQRNARALKRRDTA